MKNSGKFKPTEPERVVVSFNISNLAYVGNRKFWVTFKNKIHKNPDFTVIPFRRSGKVVEIFGDNYHKAWEELYLKIRYEEIGYKCLVIWESELLRNPTQSKKRILSFTQGSTTRDTRSDSSVECLASEKMMI